MYDHLKTLFTLIYLFYLSLAFFYYLKIIWRNFILPMLLHQEKGQGLVEYALILVMVAVVVVAILFLLGPSLQNVF